VAFFFFFAPSNGYIFSALGKGPLFLSRFLLDALLARWSSDSFFLSALLMDLRGAFEVVLLVIDWDDQVFF